MKIAVLHMIHQDDFDDAVSDIKWVKVVDLMDKKDDLALGKYLREHFESVASELTEDTGEDHEIDLRLQREMEK